MAEKIEKISYAFQHAVRMVYANVIKPRAFQVNGADKGEPRYGATFILAPDSEDLKALKELVSAELKKQYPGKTLKAGRLTEEQEAAGTHVEINPPWKDGTKEADKQKAKGKDFEIARGMVVVKASSKYPPALSAIVGGKFVDYTDPDTRAALEKQFYSGAYVAPNVSLNTYKASDGKPGGCGLWLDNVLFIKDGERIGGQRKSGAEVFRNHVGCAVDTNPNEDDSEF